MFLVSSDAFVDENVSINIIAVWLPAIYNNTIYEQVPRIYDLIFLSIYYYQKLYD